jgi:RNA polymerase sigma-70 factor (ECF subfamily)
VNVAGHALDPNHFFGERFRSVDESTQDFLARDGVLVDHLRHRGLTDTFFRRAAGDRFPGGIQERPSKIAVDLEHDRRQIVHEGPVTFFPASQDFLRGFALLDVILQRRAQGRCVAGELFDGRVSPRELLRRASPASALGDEGNEETDRSDGRGRGGDSRRGEDQAITPDVERTMAIDTRLNTPAGGADEAPDGDSRVPGSATGPSSGTNADAGRLVPEMTASSNATREGDLRFEAEALPYLDDVYRFALSLTRDAADADDVVQETFLRAYRSWHTFQPGSDARRWLFTITRNVFLRAREREHRHVELEDGDLEALSSFNSLSDQARDGSDQILTRIDLAPALRRALDELDEPFKSAVLLVDIEDQSYEAASEILGVPIGTIRSRLFRGRRILQDKLLTYARDAGFTTAQRGQRGREHD